MSFGEITIAVEIKHACHDHNLRLTFSGEMNDDGQCDGCMRTTSTPFYSCEQLLAKVFTMDLTTNAMMEIACHSLNVIFAVFYYQTIWSIQVMIDIFLLLLVLIILILLNIIVIDVSMKGTQMIGFTAVLNVTTLFIPDVLLEISHF
ncbi:hypothetical protein Gotur_028564 [Gossypium turneri]